MRAVNFSRRSAWTRAVLPLVVFLLGSPARADRPQMPPAEQADINRAIDQGVLFLKKTQLPSGSWAAEGNPNQVGYAALPALTLLECGVPADDPVVKRAGLVRSSISAHDGPHLRPGPERPVPG